MKIAIIGAGASGLMCAAKLSSSHEITIFEKNESAGKKLLLTGNGRCNVTNLKNTNDFLENVMTNSKFMFSSLNHFSPYDMYDWLLQNNIELTEEEDNKIFPANSKAKTILNLLLNNIPNNARILYNTSVVNIEKSDGYYTVSDTQQAHKFDAVIIATGGCSYDITGSTGDGYTFAKNLDHSITPLRQSLCSLKLNSPLLENSKGVSFNSNMYVTDKNNRVLCQNYGSCMITGFGITGPGIYKLTAKYKEATIAGNNLVLDLVPDLTYCELQEKLSEYSKQNPAALLSGFLDNYLVKRFAHNVKELYSDKLNIQVSNASNKAKEFALKLLKSFVFTITDFDIFDRAIVTRGGIETSELHPKTMESKLHKNLFFIGEIIDVDALTGGYSLQIAFSTATACAEYLNKLC